MTMRLDAMLTKRQRLDLLRGQLDLDRSSHLPTWKELGQFLAPRRPRFMTTDANKGDRRNQSIIDSTAVFSLRTLQSGMHAGMTSPARPWYRLTTPDPDLAEFGAVKDWLHQVTQRMNGVFLRSNLYNALPTVYGDMGAFGTAAMFVEEDDEHTIRCTTFPIGSYYIANDFKLRVRTFVREFQMTAAQLLARFGGDPRNPDWGKFSPSVRSAWERSQLLTTFDVVHIVQENLEYDPRLLESKHKRFYSCYLEKGSALELFLEEKGFDEFPVMAPRWETTGEDPYGTNCPGITAIGDVKALQLMRKRSAQAVEKKINPPLIGPAGMKTGRISLLSGDTTFWDTRKEMEGLRPIHETQIDLNDLRLDMQDVRYLVQRAFYEDLFLMLAQSDPSRGAQPVTAREIDERHEEKLLALGPVLEQTNQDLLDPLIDRTFNIMLRRGELPPAPPELEGTELRVEYISVMAQAQKAVGLAGMDRFGGFVSSVAAIVPDAVDKINTDEMIDEYAVATGVAPRLVRTDEEVAAIRDDRAKQQKAAADAAALKDASAGAKNLAQAPTTGDNALTDILASVGAAGAGSGGVL